MLGKVHGPYTRSDGTKFVVIVHHNPDGSVKNKTSIGYKRYLQEVDEGLHKYESFIRPLPKRLYKTKEETEKIRKLKLQERICSFCFTKVENGRLDRKENIYFCNESCQNKFHRRLKKKIKNIYKDQIVIEINKNTDKHYIVVEKENNKRISYFIRADLCITHISHDENGVLVYRLKYDKEKASLIKPVYGFKKYFWITETGVLVSRRTKKILSLLKNKRGYIVHATKIGGKNGSNHCFKIHRLVGLTFIKNEFNKPEINHIDGNKENNNVLNLEWVTPKENTDHAIRMGLVNIQMGEDVGTSKLSNKDALDIRKLYSTGNYTHRQIAEIYNVNNSTICDCINRKTFKHI